MWLRAREEALEERGKNNNETDLVTSRGGGSQTGPIRRALPLSRRVCICNLWPSCSARTRTQAASDVRTLWRQIFPTTATTTTTAATGERRATPTSHSLTSREPSLLHFSAAFVALARVRLAATQTHTHSPAAGSRPNKTAQLARQIQIDCLRRPYSVRTVPLGPLLHLSSRLVGRPRRISPGAPKANRSRLSRRRRPTARPRNDERCL